MESDLKKVKQLLLGKEYAELLELKERINDQDKFAEVVAHVVAEALEQRTGSDSKVSDVLAPTIDQAIAGSIDQDPKKLAESLYPIMGPAIRKSISETLQQMLENFNQLLEQSFSPQSLRWRFDAWRTGRSYSELVLLNTLEYQVEQVFLIHKETSLLIAHEYSDFSDIQDPDLVSGMFSAIQDFIEDSFSVDEHNRLDTLRLGDLTVVLHEGPFAVIAAVVRGSVPEQLRNNMSGVVEGLHARKRDQLTAYSGDQLDFADESDELRELLVMQQKEIEEERSIPWLAVGVIAVLLAASSYYGYLETQKHNAMVERLSAFDANPGIVLLDYEQRDQTLEVTALVDPSFDAVAHLEGLSFTRDVVLKPQSYLSADDEVLLEKAKKTLSPLAETEFNVVNRSLIITGSATAQWVRAHLEKWQSVPGLEAIDSSALSVYDPILDEINQLESYISQYQYEFEKEEFLLMGDQRVDDIASNILRAVALRRGQSLPEVAFDIVGYTDDSGSARLNRRIGYNRVEALRYELIDAGVAGDILHVHNGSDYEHAPDQSAREVRIFVRTLESGK